MQKDTSNLNEICAQLESSFDASISSELSRVDISTPSAAKMISRIWSTRKTTQVCIFLSLAIQIWGTIHMLGFDFLEVIAVTADGRFKVLELIK